MPQLDENGNSREFYELEPSLSPPQIPHIDAEAQLHLTLVER